MNPTIYTRPTYRNEFAIWMEKYEFTHAVTLSCPSDASFGVPGLPSNEYQGRKFVECVDLLLYRLQERVFGRGRNLQEISHATYYECWDRGGWPTYWHSHSLFLIPDTFYERFEEQVEKQWARILGANYRPDCVEVKRIGDLAGACRYASKFAQTSTAEMIDFSLPTVSSQEQANP